MVGKMMATVRKLATTRITLGTVRGLIGVAVTTGPVVLVVALITALITTVIKFITAGRSTETTMMGT